MNSPKTRPALARFQSAIAAWVLLTFVAGCNRPVDSSATSSAVSGVGVGTPVTAQLNWHPEAEHGGLYQAAADGTMGNAGFNLEIRPGGVGTPIASELVLGRSQFAIANADDVVLYRQQGADVVAVLAALQDHPRCIVAQAASDVKTFEDLAGKTFQCGGGRPYLSFLKAKGLLDNVRQVPYQNSIAALVSDPNTVIQGYSFAEPLLAREQGVEVRLLMLSDLGWNPYSSVLVTTGELIRKDPEMVRKFVAATRKGWQNYLTDGTLGNDFILAANTQGMSRPALEFGIQAMRPLAIPDGVSLEQVGRMNADRWNTLVAQMIELKLADADKVIASECYTTQFIE